MLPLKDNIPTDRAPVVTLLLIVAGVVALLLADGGSVLVALASALFLWIFAVSVEDAMSRPRFLALALAGAGAAVGIGRAIEPQAAIAVLAATGATAAAVGGGARLYPQARIVTLLLVPTAFTLHELPAWVLQAAWVAVTLAFALTAVTGPLADGGAAMLAAAGVALLLGVLAAGLLAQRRKPVPAPARSATPAWS